MNDPSGSGNPGDGPKAGPDTRHDLVLGSDIEELAASGGAGSGGTSRSGETSPNDASGHDGAARSGAGGAGTSRESASGEEKRSRWYWFRHHAGVRFRAFLGRHKLAVFLLSTAALVLLFLSRSLWQPGVLLLRIYLVWWVLTLLGLFVARWGLRRRSLKLTLTGLVFALLVAAFRISPVYDYVSLFIRYQTFPQVDLRELPVSGNERIQPLNSIFSLAHEKMVETEAPCRPDFVRVRDELGNESYRWTMAIEPAYLTRRILEPVRQVYSVSATSPAPDFSKDNRKEVSFDVGENLKLGRQTHTAVLRSFGPWRFLNYEPEEVTYVTDDKGDWVQVVTLVKWTGLFFPRPEFGGVQLIRQNKGGLDAAFERGWRGRGEWIPPAEIAKHPFLHGQNLNSQEVARTVARSFRYQAGFLAPMPGRHKGDIRIPDLPDDVNNQPFTTYFGASGKMPAGLYHYFALEPFDPSKQGLNTSLFLPADGTRRVYVYRHHELSGSLTGVSAVGAKVRESKKNYDWTTNRPVEHRPFIRTIAGERRFFWLTTVVTYKEDVPGAGVDSPADEGAPEGRSTRFIAGSFPEVVITDAAQNVPVWVDAANPAGWERELEVALSQVWSDR